MCMSVIQNEGGNPSEAHCRHNTPRATALFLPPHGSPTAQHRPHYFPLFPSERVLGFGNGPISIPAKKTERRHMQINMSGLPCST